jgi:hypothetical protein
MSLRGKSLSAPMCLRWRGKGWCRLNIMGWWDWIDINYWWSWGLWRMQCIWWGWGLWRMGSSGSSSNSTLTRGSGSSWGRGSFGPSSVVKTFGMSYAMNIEFFKGLLFPSTNGTISLTLYFS